MMADTFLFPEVDLERVSRTGRLRSYLLSGFNIFLWKSDILAMTRLSEGWGVGKKLERGDE